MFVDFDYILWDYEVIVFNKNKNNKETVYVFIDASNLWEAQKAKGRLFDLEKLKMFLINKYKDRFLNIFYYTAYPANGTREYSLEGKQKFFIFLNKGLGFIVRKKELKRIKTVNNFGESIQEKGNMDVEMVIDALHYIKKYNTAVFFTGDSDFLALVTYLRNHEKKVYIYSSKNNISQELRTGADGYFDVLNLEDDIWRGELKHRVSK
ncbi:MAG TPA: NYN domain-containing protein [Ignavibacteria bacterium]|nr:NYN domain-containing protein [Ignavibacteria bacterium]